MQHDSKTSLSSQQNEGQAVGKTRPQSSKIKSGFSQASKKLFKKLSNKTKSQEKSPQAELQQDATPGSSMIEPPINPPKSNNKENYESNSGVKNDDEELEEEFVTRHMLYKEAMYTRSVLSKFTENHSSIIITNSQINSNCHFITVSTFSEQRQSGSLVTRKRCASMSTKHLVLLHRCVKHFYSLFVQRKETFGNL